MNREWSVAELDAVADQMRLVNVRLQTERNPMIPAGALLLAWKQLMESERNQWRDLARAATEVL